MNHLVKYTPNDMEMIFKCLQEVMRAINGDTEACDQVCYNLDESDMWLSVGAEPHAITITLTDDVDDAGYPSGNIYATVEFTLDYVMEILGKEE